MLTDQIADMLTRIRNASAAHKKTVSIPSSKVKKELTRILHEHRFINRYAFIEDGKQGIIKILLKYDENLSCVIRGLQRVSTPGRRVYRSAEKLPRVLNGMGFAIVSTSKGMMTDVECRKLNVGGEVVAKVW